jgi:hypothetical protein
MRSRIRFPTLPWGFFLEGEDSHGDHGLGSSVELRLRPLLVLHIHVSPSTSSGQRNCDSWASQPQKLVTLRPQPGGETTKSIRDMWWHWKKYSHSLTELSAKWKQRTFEGVHSRKAVDRYLCDLGFNQPFIQWPPGGEMVETWSSLLTSIHCPSSK